MKKIQLQILVYLFLVNLGLSAQEQDTLPTFMTGIEYADPSEGIVVMEAPTANPTGNANLSHPIKIPAGRNGMSPGLSISYESNSGHSWLGTDWNITSGQISVDTRWGVPRFSPATETEPYLYNGQQLYPSAHRNTQPRSAEKEFSPRVLQDFEKIKRRGNRPDNYWWEVTAKDGNTYSYGGSPSTGVIESAVWRGQGRNIGIWELTRIEDTDGNFIQYFYEKVSENTFADEHVYLKKIEYTGFQDQAGSYQIEFIRDQELGENQRPDIDINTRYGSIHVCAQLLRKIQISFQNQIIRSYDLEFTQGEFDKTLLHAIAEYDMNGEEFYRHSFEYYNDIAEQKYSDPIDWSVNDDNVIAPIENPIPGFTGESSMLGASSSSYITGGATITVGPIGDPTSKRFSAGPSGGYASSTSEGLLSLVDLNGDGLPDKVFKDKGLLYFRPNLYGSGQNAFGEKSEIKGITDFTISRTQSFLVGAEVNAGIAFAGYEYTNSTITSDTYFADYNGDGLTDIVYKGAVYFNHIENGLPVFTTSSNDTPNPVISGGLPDLSIEPDTVDKSQLFPLHDVVRLWQAPCDGIININAPVRLLENMTAQAQAYSKKDGVLVSIQKNMNPVWSASIDPDDYNEKSPSLNNITINKGDHIYFRVHSIMDGAYDQVFWDPSIEYVAGPLPERDANNYEITKYKASADFLLASPQVLIVPQNGTINVVSKFSKPITSDNLELKITRIRDSVPAVIYTEQLAFDHATDTSWSIDGLEVQIEDELYFQVVASTQIDWGAINWQPLIYYTATDNPDIMVYAQDGTPLISFCPAVDFTMYNNTVQKASAWIAPVDGVLEIMPTITGAPGIIDLSGPATVSVKSINRLIIKDDYRLSSATAAPLVIDVTAGDTLFVEIHSQNPFAGDLDPDLTGVRFNGSDQSIKVGLYLANKSDQMLFGPLYRGWGGFVYDGNGLRGVLPIDESKLEIDTALADSEIDPDEFDFENPEELEGKFEKSNPIFTILMIDGKNQCWNGVDNLTYIKDSIMSSSRNGLDDISDPEFSVAGIGIQAPSRIFKSQMHSVAGGADAGVSSLTAGYSNNNTKLIQDIQDLNGDRYPDVLRESGIYYSTPGGDREKTQVTFTLGLHEASSYAVGGSLGGGYVTSSASNSGDSRSNNKKVNRTKGKQGNMSKKASKATESASNSAGISGEFNYDQDEIISTWMDMNGDGLVDKINKDGMVSLNLGYSFAEPVSWGITGIRGGDSYDYGGGLGINYANGSIVAGVSLNRTENFTKFALEDLNGDGLPDYIVSVDPLMVRFNTGAGFAPTVEWTALQAIEEGSSVGESVNVAFTACVNLFGFRICVNPNFATGQGVSRQLMQLVDIDNDGFLDILRSNHDGDLSVQLSQVGRTNMLKKITRPLGGSIALDYEITGNNYDLPFGQWVLSAIISHDGFDPDRSPLTKTRIVYEGAKMDRRERESYGFSKVIIQELDSEQQDSIYRIVEQNYLQDHYYNKGLLSSECIKNSDGLKFVETTYSYQMLDPQNLQPLPSSELIQHRQVFPALYQKVDTYYEGMVAPQLSHRMEYTYDPKGNVIRMVDYGDGSESDQLTIDYSYHDLDDLEIYDLMKSKIISNQNEVLRKTEYDIDVSGNIIEERNYLEDGTFAVTEKEYDEFGNLTKIIYPKNASGQRSFEEFQYDEVIQTYRVSKTDQFGYTTRYKYDFLFGRLIELIDINQNQFSWTLDAKGREMYYLDPLGQKAGVDHTIAYEYKHQAIPAYSLVRHYDASLDHYIETFQFIDGFLRPIQNKKTALVQQTPTQDPQLSMTVSGWMKYDAFGRMQLLYHPIAEPEADKEQVNTSRHPAQPVKIGYDILDRVIQTNLQDGSIMRDIHNIAPDRDGNLLFKTMSIDALGNKSATYTDVRGRKRAKSEFDEEGEIWTTFSYNAVDELVQSSNHFLYSTLYQYDHFGRLIEKQFPDQGPTNFYYDLAGNMTHKITANIREKIPNGGRIKYTYDFDRLIRIDYPKNIQNTVIYHYGTADSEFNRAGRVWLVEDASGGQEYFYNELGQVIKNYRTVIVDQTNISTYVTAFEYDSWKRIKKLIYPDNEIVTYHYDQGGNVTRIVGEKEGHTYRYIDAMGYDAFGDLIYQKLGNGVESVHRFEDGRRRVSSIESKTASGTIFNSNQYQYDAEDNLTLWSRQADPSIGIGGEENYAYQYDPLYRISNATGSFNGQENAEFFISLSYDKLYNITAKSEKMVKNANQIDTAFEQQYQYSFERPHQLSSKNGQEYEFDANGNLSERTSQITFDHRQLIWDEEDRMMGVAENGILSQYTYDAADRRVIKSSGGSRGIFLDGAAAGIVNHQDNYKVYVNPFLTIEQDQFTKHYYIGSQRFMSKIGTGKFVHDLIPTFRKLYAGNLDFSKRQYLIQQTLQNYYKELGIPPGPPTLFGYYAQPDITGSPLPQNDTLSAYTAPPLDWPLPIGPPDTTGPPGQPIWVEAETELGRPGYGFIGDDVFSEINQFFYHSDHLGSTAYVTDLTGTIRQFTSYQPFGKTFVQQKNTPESQPYLFNSKELDENTGLVYFGARYLDSESSVWQNVDPLAEKYPSISPYAFVGQNPVNYIDPDGKKIAIHYRYRNQNKVFKFGSRQVPNNKFVKETLKSFVYLGQSKTALKLIDQAHHLPQTIHIRQIRELGKENFLPYKRQIEYNPQSGLSLDNGGEMTPALGLLHELDHAVEYIRNEKQYFYNRKKELPGYDNAEEKRVIRGVEYQAAIELGEGTRSDHLGRTIETEGPTTTKRRRVLKGKNKAGNRNFTMGRKGML